MDFGFYDLSLRIFPSCVLTFILECGFTEFPQFEKKWHIKFALTRLMMRKKTMWIKEFANIIEHKIDLTTTMYFTIYSLFFLFFFFFFSFAFLLFFDKNKIE